MKVTITQKGVQHEGEALSVGDEISVEGDTMPGWLVGKAVPMKDGKVAVTNPASGALPASGADRQAQMKAAAVAMDQKGFNEDGTPDLRVLNASLPDGVENFSKDERDQIWPGIASTVKAERG